MQNGRSTDRVGLAQNWIPAPGAALAVTYRLRLLGRLLRRLWYLPFPLDLVPAPLPGALKDTQNLCCYGGVAGPVGVIDKLIELVGKSTPRCGGGLFFPWAEMYRGILFWSPDVQNLASLESREKNCFSIQGLWRAPQKARVMRREAQTCWRSLLRVF